MKINEIRIQSGKPSIYSSGSHIMWTDEHISKQLLQIHLNPDIDLASRKSSTIDKTVSWILTHCKTGCLDILDLGCGPGLYTEKLAEKGHRVTGVDFSQVSINHAVKSASERNLSTTYLRSDYLSMDLRDNSFDLVLMIYTDFGVLSPQDRKLLLSKIYTALKPGGLFIFDVLNDRNWKEKGAPCSWDCSEGGFWSPDPYLHLSASHFYEEQKVILYQHLLLNEADELKTYHFWTHFLSHDDLTGILKPTGFQNLTFHEDVLPVGDQFSGENVTFSVALRLP